MVAVVSPAGQRSSSEKPFAFRRLFIYNSLVAHLFRSPLSMTVPQLRSPIVLVHGLFGFDQVRMGPWVVVDYFNGIPPVLRAAGNRVLVPKLSPTASIASRAAQLKAFIDRESPDAPVHLIGHSLGGLDCRYMITHLGMTARVLSLTTLGTPHRGCYFADWALGRFSRLFGTILDQFHVPREAFDDLTVARCKKFNEETPDAPAVRYFSIGGHYPLHWSSPSWRLTAPLVARVEGPNDGVVSLSSAKWGESFEVWEADHMSLVNWPGPLKLKHKSNRILQYGELLGRLRDEGF
jgi:triacylglycerol lipase